MIKQLKSFLIFIEYRSFITRYLRCPVCSNKMSFHDYNYEKNTVDYLCSNCGYNLSTPSHVSLSFYGFILLFVLWIIMQLIGVGSAKLITTLSGFILHYIVAIIIGILLVYYLIKSKNILLRNYIIIILYGLAGLFYNINKTNFEKIVAVGLEYFLSPAGFAFIIILGIWLITRKNSSIILQDIDKQIYSELEWEKIAQMMSHTLKKPNNIILREIKILMNQISDTGLSTEMIERLKNIKANSVYANKIIYFFDIFRNPDKINKNREELNSDNLIDLLEQSINELISVSNEKHNFLTQSTVNKLGKLKIINKTQNKNIKYSINKDALKILFDEIVLNLYKYTESIEDKSSVSDNLLIKKDFDNIAKPEKFEILVHDFFNSISFEFYNSSYMNLYEKWNIVDKYKSTSGTSISRESFGLLIMNKICEKTQNMELSVDPEYFKEFNINKMTLVIKK